MTRKFTHILLAAFILVIAAFFFFTKGDFFGINSRRVAWRALEEKVKKESLEFNGQTAIAIKSFDTNWQILINDDRLFPSASLVKIPIMAACFYAADEGKMSLEERLRLEAAHKVSGSGILKYASIGGKYSVEELIELMISKSDNIAANMLIDRLEFDYLNGCFKRLRLKDTNISRKMMDFESRKEGRENFTTASDLAYLLDRIYHKRLLNEAYSQKCIEFLKKQKTRSRIPARLPPDTPVAHKTGLEKGVCHDAGIVFSPKGDFLICVLTQHKNKTSRLAKDFIAQIAFDVYNYCCLD